MISQADFPTLTEFVDFIFNETAKNKVVENVGFKVFDVSDTNKRSQEELLLHGMSGVRKVTPGEDLPNVTSVEGDTVTWTQAYYGALVSINIEMRQFDLYNQIESVVKTISEDAFDKIDQSLADRILGGFGNTYIDPYGETQSSLAPDGIMLFNASHTTPISSDTYSNVIVSGGVTNPTLSRDAIVAARLAASTHRDPNGMIRPVNLDTLIIPRALEDLAMRIVGSQYLPGSANNDINPLYNRVKVVVWDRLAQNSAGTDTTGYWFMVDSNKVKESLKCLFAKRPALAAPEEVYKNKNWDYSLDFFYTVGTGHPAYIYGSNGTES
jgi:hypothetical protein